MIRCHEGGCELCASSCEQIIIIFGKTTFMKKLFLTFIVLSAILLSNCSTSSVDRDIRKMANLFCEEVKLRSKVNDDNPNAQKELDDIHEKIKKLSDEFEKKYKGKKNDAEIEKKSDKIFAEVMANCK